MARQCHTAIALDLASTVGWAFIKDGKIKHSGVVTFKKPDEHPGHKFVRFNNWLQENFRGVDEIFYEIVPRFESAAWARINCGMLAVLQLFSVVHGIKITGIKPNVVKKIFTGKGNANKMAMCEVAHAMGWRGGLPGTEKEHDAADAIAIGYSILKARGIEVTIA